MSNARSTVTAIVIVEKNLSCHPLWLLRLFPTAQPAKCSYSCSSSWLKLMHERSHTHAVSAQREVAMALA